MIFAQVQDVNQGTEAVFSAKTTSNDQNFSALTPNLWYELEVVQREPLPERLEEMIFGLF